MIRPRLALATFLLATLGLAAGADAADLAGILLAQSPTVPRGPGLYLNLFKFVPVVVIYLLWAWTTYWVDDDTKDLGNQKHELWNSAIFFSGLLGLALVWAIPIYPIGLTLLILAYLIPVLSYVYARNQMVPDDDKVLTPYHKASLVNGLMNKAGMKDVQQGEVELDRPCRRPIQFVGKTQGSASPIPSGSRGRAVEFYMSAKELVYDAVLRRATDIHLEPTPSSRRSATASTASCTRPSRSTARPATR
jgi:hypothetical protein